MFVTATWLLHTCASSHTAMQHDFCGHLHTRKEQVMQICGSWQPLRVILSVGLPVNTIFSIMHDCPYSLSAP